MWLKKWLCGGNSQQRQHPTRNSCWMINLFTVNEPTGQKYTPAGTAETELRSSRPFRAAHRIREDVHCLMSSSTGVGAHRGVWWPSHCSTHSFSGRFSGNIFSEQKGRLFLLVLFRNFQSKVARNTSWNIFTILVSLQKKKKTQKSKSKLGSHSHLSCGFKYDSLQNQTTIFLCVFSNPNYFNKECA